MDAFQHARRHVRYPCARLQTLRQARHQGQPGIDEHPVIPVAAETVHDSAEVGAIRGLGDTATLGEGIGD